MPAHEKPTVFVVDDDSAVRDSIAQLLRAADLSAETFASAAEFSTAYTPARRGCLVLDVAMPEISGLQLQEQLNQLGIEVPIIIVSGHVDVAGAVKALRGGAIDVVLKPFDPVILLERVHTALALDAQRRAAASRRRDAQALLARLSPREHEVMLRLVAGESSKQVALALGLSSKTVDIHRGHILTKLGAESVLQVAEIERSARI